MSDKCFGDYINRNTVKNPLLSTAVTGLSIEDLTHNAVLLPVAQSQGLIARLDDSGSQSATLAYADRTNVNLLSGDANSNILHSSHPPNVTNKPTENQQHVNQSNQTRPTVSKTSVKSEDDFDVNEYFARLQGTRYVSAPINSLLKEDSKPVLEATEENLEEINLNEPEKVVEQQSLTSDIAQNFSQLPTVLPQVASAVFSSFSNMLYKSREQTPDEGPVRNPGYQEVQFQKPEEVGVQLVGVSEPPVAKEVAPPPKEPPIAGPGNYRITTKKKAYAQIPGLSSGDGAHVPFNPQPSFFPPSNVSQATTIPYSQDEIKHVQAPSNNQQFHIFNPLENVDKPEIKKDDIINITTNVDSKAGSDAAYNIFNPLDNVDKPQIKEENTKTYDMFNTIPNDGNQASSDVTYNMFNPIEITQQKGQDNNQNIERKESMPIQMFSQTANQLPAATPIIPPPPMFSNVPRTDNQAAVKSVLPPSVARRIGSNHPIIKPQTMQASIPTQNIFVPAPISDNQETNIPPFSVQASISVNTASTMQQMTANLPPSMSTASAFVQFNPQSSAESSSAASIPTSNVAQLSTSQGSISSNSGLAYSLAPPPQSESKDISTIQTVFVPTASQPESAPPPMFFNPSNMPSASLAVGAPSNSNIPTLPASIFAPNTTTESVRPPPTFLNPQSIQSTQENTIKSDLQSNLAGSLFPQYFDQNSASEPPKPVLEPPKVTGNTNYRMTKKRPQYYAGPIEGVGAISNSVKPTLSALEPQAFQGALFTPEQNPVAPIQQPASDLQSSLPFDISKPAETSSTFTPYDINPPQVPSYAQNYNTAFDMSRQTTDNYEPPKQESKGFGIIGSLKSKLSSIDINKIQNSVTTFFDPAYNEGPKEPATQNFNYNFEPSHHPLGYYPPQESSTLEIYVPSQQSQTFEQQYTQFGYQNPYSYDSYTEGQLKESLFSDKTPASSTQTYGIPQNDQTSYSDTYNSNAQSLPNTSHKNVEKTEPAASQISTANQSFDTPSYASMPHSVIHTKLESEKDKENDAINVSNSSNIASVWEQQDVSDISALSFGNEKPAEKIAAATFFDKQQYFKLSQPVETEELSQKLETLQISQQNQDSISEEKSRSERSISEAFSNITDISSSINQPKDISVDFFSNLNRVIDNKPVDLHGSFGDKDRNIGDEFSLLDNKVEKISHGLPSYEEAIGAATINLSQVPLFGLSNLLAEQTKEMTEVENKIEHTSFFAPSQSESRETSNLFETENKVPTVEEDDDPLNICETCREVNKPEEKDVDDFTSQLIENITAPIQLSNPVVAPLTESNTPVDDTSNFDIKQCEEISHITEETIETIQVQSATELLDDDNQINNNVRHYGWTTEETPYLTSDVLSEHDYAFQINPNALGFYGNNPMFFDDIPNNASDEIKAEFKSTHEESPTILPRQISIPTAPPVEDEDSKSDETGVLDVQSIEQDAKKDFPIYEEFVIEPSETDDDKIEYKERERSSDDPVPEVDTFTNRVERFKKMEETSVEKNDEVSEPQKSLLYKFNNASSPAITIASYFDTGNYAAEAHYRNSISSPSTLFTSGSPNLSMRIPPGFEEEYKRRLSGMAEKLDINEKTSDDISNIPDSSNQGPVTTTYSCSPNLTSPDTDRAIVQPPKIPTLTEVQKLPDFSSVFGEKSVPEKLTSSLFTNIEDEPTTSKVEAKSDIKETTPVKPEPVQQTLPDPLSFFSSPEEKTTEAPDNSFNRLASYFASPAKTDHGKSFFELSQSQNHYRHASEDKNVTDLKKLENSNQDLIHNIPQDVYLANLSLMNDLTSCQNVSFDTKDQIVRTINYYSVEYDNPIEIKALHVNSAKNEVRDKSENKTKLELEENDEEYVSRIVSKCKYCCGSEKKVAVKVGAGQGCKVRAAANSESEVKDNGEMELNKEKGETKKDVKVSMDTLQQNEKEGVTVASENRSSTSYSPVRHHWFYRVEIEGKSIWRGFSVADNKALEEAFLSPDLNENTVVATDGGRFDVNIIGRLRVAVYWSDKPTNVQRCSWFYKGNTDARYVPYAEAVAEKLEEEYRHGVTTGEWHRRLVLPNNELVVMHGPAVMVHFPQAPDAFGSVPLLTFGKRVHRNPPAVRVRRDEPAVVDHLLLLVHGAGEHCSRRVKEKMESAMRPHVVRRGFDETEIEDTEPSSIDHLLLLCHGVGSACDMKFRSVEEVVDDFRATSLQLLQSHYRNSYENGVVNRIEVLPISWHSFLHSGETGVDKRLAAITLDSIPRLRSFTNDTVLDVLFYTSPVFCQTIIDAVCSELNRIYRLFMSRNPQFKGRVSLGGHSLGSVILYDLLCHQKQTGSDSPKKYVNGRAGTGQAAVHYPPLHFQPAALYALGSPIAMFECIRGVKSLGSEFSLPTCKNFFNIFHPYDPIAYRIEPLINPQMGQVKPFLIPHHKGRKRMHLELKETMARVGADLKARLVESLKATWTSVWAARPPIDSGLEKVVEEEMEKEQLCDESKEDQSQNNDSLGPAMLGALNAGRRVDYVLQEAPFEMINEYLFAMSSHVCYWESEDTMLLILREVYDSMGVQPDCTVPQQTMTVQRTRLAKQDGTVIVTTGSDNPSTSRGGT